MVRGYQRDYGRDLPKPPKPPKPSIRRDSEDEDDEEKDHSFYSRRQQWMPPKGANPPKFQRPKEENSSKKPASANQKPKEAKSSFVTGIVPPVGGGGGIGTGPPLGSKQPARQPYPELGQAGRQPMSCAPRPGEEPIPLYYESKSKPVLRPSDTRPYPNRPVPCTAQQAPEYGSRHGAAFGHDGRSQPSHSVREGGLRPEPEYPQKGSGYARYPDESPKYPKDYESGSPGYGPSPRYPQQDTGRRYSHDYSTYRENNGPQFSSGYSSSHTSGFSHDVRGQPRYNNTQGQEQKSDPEYPPRYPMGVLGDGNYGIPTQSTFRYIPDPRSPSVSQYEYQAPRTYSSAAKTNLTPSPPPPPPPPPPRPGDWMKGPGLQDSLFHHQKAKELSKVGYGKKDEIREQREAAVAAAVAAAANPTNDEEDGEGENKKKPRNRKKKMKKFQGV